MAELPGRIEVVVRDGNSLLNLSASLQAVEDADHPVSLFWCNVKQAVARAMSQNKVKIPLEDPDLFIEQLRRYFSHNGLYGALRDRTHVVQLLLYRSEGSYEMHTNDCISGNRLLIPKPVWGLFLSLAEVENAKGEEQNAERPR